MATKGEHKFNDREVKALLLLYDNPGAEYTTYTLTQRLHPTVVPGSDEDSKAFKEVAQTTEGLKLLNLVDGTRLKDGADRIYYSDLKLTRSGERKAIELKQS